MSLKTYREKFNDEVNTFIINKLKECGITSGQVSIQIEDLKYLTHSKEEDITENKPVIISTALGILFASKKDF